MDASKAPPWTVLVAERLLLAERPPLSVCKCVLACVCVCVSVCVCVEYDASVGKISSKRVEKAGVLRVGNGGSSLDSVGSGAALLSVNVLCNQCGKRNWWCLGRRSHATAGLL